MRLFKKIGPVRHCLQKFRDKKYYIGFVPTMGALHEGHLSLIQQCKKLCDLTVCSIFINPVQFNDPKDFEKYPVTLENDILLLERDKTDVLFLPSVKEIYPGGITNLHQYDLDNLENILEGYYRPGHFQGVCNAVHCLLDIVRPDKIFLGQKDYQQCLVVKKMMDVFFPQMEVVIASTVRESNGLAMSSRNMRLSDAARSKAGAIYEALQFIKNNFRNQSIGTLKQEAVQNILSAGFDKVDYVEICDAETLKPITVFENDRKLVALAAAFIEDVRLIDNVMFD
ncbi:MAG TPA: pantoate--beta-alanine ligase [Parafilimonas sp.]|nr:pantoate--beta-alanine ligase [Parafilimonas sp.]